MLQEKEEQLFRKRVLELAELCFHRDMPSNTDFLNLNEQTIFQSISGTIYRQVPAFCR